MKNHQQFTKIISIMLCLVLMFSSTPNVFAVDIGDSASSADALLQKNVSETSEEIVLNETKIGTFSSDIRQKVFSFTPDEDGKYVIKIDSEYYTQTTVQDSENNWVNDNSGYSYSFVLSLSANNSYKISTSLWEDASNGTYDITIEKAIAATSLEIIQDTDIGYVGEYGYLYTVFGPENATEESITWESSNSDVVKIIDIYNDALLETGHVRLEFVSAGEVAITATSENGLTDSINFTVTERPNATSIVIENGDNITGFVGITQQLWANFFPEGSLSEDLTWTSDDETVATIDENGYVTFLNTGNVNITVTSERGLTDTCTITVEDFETIEVDQEKNVILDDKTEAYYYFTPEEDGYYIFYSYNNDYDTYGYILNSDMEEIASDDDSGDDNNFKVGCQLEAGATYILKARFYNTEDKGSFTICVEKSRYITGLEIVSMPEKTEYIEGSDVNSIDYDGLELKVTWSDGTTTDWAYEYDWWIEDEEFCIDVAAFAETGEVVLICGEASVKLTFTIIENPVDHIELVSGTEYSYIENYDGYVYEDEEREYFYYYTSYPHDATIKIVYTDGTSTTAQVGDSVNDYYISWNDNQHNEPWVVGTNNKSIVEYLGHTVVLPITVKENTVTGIEIVSGKITCVENTYGYETEEGWYYYNYYEMPYDVTIRITYSDETSKVVSIHDVVDGYGFDLESDQYQNPWVLGDDNYLTVSYLGKQAQLQVSIIENPVDHIELVSGTEYSYIENYDGYIAENENGGEYFYYYASYPSDATIKIVYTDGTSTTAQVGDSVNDYYISWNDNQHNEPWVVGTNNKSIVEYLGHTVVLPITVKENPVTGIEIVSGKITCVENTYGYETEEGWYYYYDIPHDVTVRITYSDETSKVVSIHDEVDGYVFNWEADQYENPWVLGDDNFLTVSYLGHEALLPVSIIECPVESIVINSAPTREYIYGDIEYGYLSPDGEYEFYPTDLSGLSFTVYYFDGTNKTFTADDIDEYGYINGYRYELHYDEYNAQIGDFPVEFMYMGKTADYVVQLKESIASSITVTKQPNKTEYGSYYRPDFIGMELTITFADESTKVVTLTEDNLVYEFNPWWGELMYTVDIDGYNLTLAPYYGEDDMHYVAYYLGASCDILDVIFTEEKEISSIELDNVTWNGDGMTVKITYADETTETLTLDLVDFFDYEDSTASGCGMTGKGFLCYYIETYYDNNGSVEEYIVYIFDRQITVKADAILLGDVNSDGSVDNLDCLILTRYLANWDGYTEADINMAASDVNQDDSVDNLDCLILTRHLANWEGYEVLGIN